MTDFDVDEALRHLSNARLELAGLGLNDAAQRVAELIDDIDHGTTEKEE